MVLVGHEQRLGSGEAAANSGAWATGLDTPAHRSGHGHPSRDGQRLSACRRRCRPRSGWSAERVAAKTGHRAGGVHRPMPLKTGYHRDGVHRPWAITSTGARAKCEILRAIPCDHDRPGGRRPNGLRRGTDGPRREHREVPSRAPLRVHPRLLAQIRAAADVAIECADLGGARRLRCCR
jgi:hypothetical protein